MANEDRGYLERVRSLPCARCKTRHGICAHHLTGAGMGLRAHDHQTIPMCHNCHMQFHAASGQFKTLDKAARMAWQKFNIELTQRRLGIFQDASEPSAV